MSTTRAQLHVHSNPVSPDRLADYDAWYDEVHIPQVLERIDGIVAAHRIELASFQVIPAEALPTHRYVAIYEIDSEDVGATLNGLQRALGDGTLDTTDAIDVRDRPPSMVVYTSRELVRPESQAGFRH